MKGIILLFFMFYFMMACKPNHQAFLKSPDTHKITEAKLKEMKMTLDSLKSLNYKASLTPNFIFSKPDIIEGVYYIEGYNRMNFVLTQRKPETDYSLIHKLIFTTDGRIFFKNLTTNIGCANGFLFLRNGRWKKIKRNHYLLIFDEDYFFEAYYRIQAKYNLEILGNKDRKLTMLKLFKKEGGQCEASYQNLMDSLEGDQSNSHIF